LDASALNVHTEHYTDWLVHHYSRKYLIERCNVHISYFQIQDHSLSDIMKENKMSSNPLLIRSLSYILSTKVKTIMTLDVDLQWIRNDYPTEFIQ
jgi:hypothetical protein